MPPLKSSLAKAINVYEEHPIGTAYLITLLYLVITVIWLYPAFSSSTQFSEGYYGIRLNLVGDFLAGVFAPIACIWFIMSMFQTSRALKLQQKEFKAASQAIELQTEATKLQAEEVRNSIKEMQEAHKTAKANALHIEKDVFLTEAGIIRDELKAYAQLLLNSYLESNFSNAINAKGFRVFHGSYMKKGLTNENIAKYILNQNNDNNDYLTRIYLLNRALDTLNSDWPKQKEVKLLIQRFTERCEYIFSLSEAIDKAIYKQYYYSDLGTVYHKLKSTYVASAIKPPN